MASACGACIAPSRKAIIAIILLLSIGWFAAEYLALLRAAKKLSA